jgi:uncharacterized membrane protein (Fun14 family)
MATAAVIGMATSLLLAGFVARNRKQKNWIVYTVTGTTMLDLVALDYFGVVSVFYRTPQPE